MNANRMIARELCRAQASSDTGKEINDLHFKGAWNNAGYEVKNNHILNAIRLIKSGGSNRFSYYVAEEPDQNGKPSVIVFFEYEGLQMSFHSPKWKAQELIPLVGTGRPTAWNGIIGGSRETCRQLIKEYHLA